MQQVLEKLKVRGKGWTKGCSVMGGSIVQRVAVELTPGGGDPHRVFREQ